MTHNNWDESSAQGQSSWLWWWLALLGAGVYLGGVARALLGGISDGELLAMLVPILLALLGLGWQVHRTVRPYRARFSKYPHDEVPAGIPAARYTFKRAVLPGRTAKLYLRVWPKSTFRAEWFDIRFIERSWLDGRLWKDAPAGRVAITGVRVPQWESQWNAVPKPETEHGTFRAYYQRPVLWTENEAVTFEITLVSTDDWSGHITFRSHLSGRRSVKRPVKIDYIPTTFI